MDSVLILFNLFPLCKGNCQVIQVMITLNTFIVPFVQILTSAPAVPTTATVHLPHVQTQWDPLVVHVTVLTLEMAEVAIYHQVIIRQILWEDVHSLDHQSRPLFTLVRGTLSPGGGGLSKIVLSMCRWLLRAPTHLQSIL